MQMLNRFRSRHAEIQEIIATLNVLLSAGQLNIPPNAKNAYQLLCRLSDLVKEHLAAEDRGLYPSLLVHEDPKVKSIAWGFISGERPLRRLFEDYRHRWLENCDFNFTEPFLVETREMFGLITDRIEREERLLFPRLEQIGGGTLIEENSGAGQRSRSGAGPAGVE